MKKRTLLAVLLVVPMGAAFAHGYKQSEGMLGIQSAAITSGESANEARLGTQSATSSPSWNEPDWKASDSSNWGQSKKWNEAEDFTSNPATTTQDTATEMKTD